MSLCSKSVEEVYIGRANSIDIELTDNGLPITHSDITRVTVTLDDEVKTVIDSQVDVSVFDWSSNPYLSMRFGLKDPALPTGTHTGVMVVYDAQNPAGIRWEEVLLLYVVQE